MNSKELAECLIALYTQGYLIITSHEAYISDDAINVPEFKKIADWEDNHWNSDTSDEAAELFKKFYDSLPLNQAMNEKKEN
jgi:hypothetical protein